MSASTPRSLRVNAPSRRFSSEVMSATMRRPSITWKMPRRTILSGSMPLIRSPSNRMSPRVTSPSSVFSRPEIAFSVVDLPAPLAPSKATIAPFGTSRLRPRSTRMTSSYTTSIFFTDNSGAVTAAGVGPREGCAGPCSIVVLKFSARSGESESEFVDPPRFRVRAFGTPRNDRPESSSFRDGPKGQTRNLDWSSSSAAPPRCGRGGAMSAYQPSQSALRGSSMVFTFSSLMVPLAIRSLRSPSVAPVTLER